MPILQRRTRRYGKACDHKVSGSGGSGWDRSCLSIHCCMDHVSEVCQWASPLPAGEGLETVWAQISRTTLANWIITVHRNYFQPMYDYFHRELLKRSFAMADETRVQVLNEEGRRARPNHSCGCSEAARTGFRAIILYGYSPTRNGSHAREFLKGYSGYLETDGYQGYNNLPGIRRCSCWAHIRRYFIDAVPKGKQYDYSQPAVQGSPVLQPVIRH